MRATRQFSHLVGARPSWSPFEATDLMFPAGRSRDASTRLATYVPKASDIYPSIRYMESVLKRISVVACAIGCVAVVTAARAQDAGGSAATRRIEARIRALQRESERLAGSARTLAGELRSLEVARDLRVAESAQAEAAVADASKDLAATSERLAALERQRVAQLPGLKAQLVGLYKRGNAGTCRCCSAPAPCVEFGRASRALAAMGERQRRRLEAHRQTLEAVRTERAELEARATTLRERQEAAQRSRASAERAVSARAARIAEVDARRDLAAQYVGELQVARDGLLQALATRDNDPAAEVGVPLAPFRGALEWPVAGRLTARFAQPANRLGGLGRAQRDRDRCVGRHPRAGRARRHRGSRRPVHRLRQPRHPRPRRQPLLALWLPRRHRGGRRSDRGVRDGARTGGTLSGRTAGAAISRCESTGARSIPYNGCSHGKGVPE